MKKIFGIVCCTLFLITGCTGAITEMGYTETTTEHHILMKTSEASVIGLASKIEGGIEHINIAVLGFFIIRQGSEIFQFKGGDDITLIEFDGHIITVLNINLVFGSCADWVESY